MSNAWAIAAATATLRDLLERVLKRPPAPAVRVTARPPDKARTGITGNQVNLFLFQAMPDAAWRNMDMPRQLKPGETGQPPLPLTLSYLLTAYSDDLDDVKTHMVLGRAMRVLHDHPLLSGTEIKDATESTVADSDLHEQIERVRITLQPLPVEELSKLWTAFQTHYRTSAAYQVSVVLIESTRSAKTALPVLERGKGDTGVISQPDVDSPFPALLDLVLPEGQRSARLGELVTLKGRRLDAGTAFDVLLSNPHLPGPAPVTAGPRTAEEIEITLTDTSAAWVAGFYTVAVVTTSGDGVRTTNELALTVAPRILTLPPGVIGLKADNSAEISVTFSPQFRPGQRAVLLVGDREVPAEPLLAPPAPTDTLKFVVKNAPVGPHFVRLRIDGVDSLLVKNVDGKPTFDPAQRVTIS